MQSLINEEDFIDNAYDKLAYLIPRKGLNDIKGMDYLAFSAYIGDPNVAPGGWTTIRNLFDHIHVSDQDSILDVGSNTGHSSFLIEYYSQAKVVGIDIRKDLVQIAEKIAKEISSKAEFYDCDIKALPFDDETFSIITTTGTLAFLSEGHDKALCEMRRVLKEDGIVIDTCLYYEKEPPEHIVKEASKVLESDILDYNLEEYIKLYKKCGFQVKKSYALPTLQNKTTQNEVIDLIVQREEYLCELENQPFESEVKELLQEKMCRMFDTFSKNDEYVKGEVLFFEKSSLGRI
ncbi:class I SAM-dependent methyltransferase [Pseudalkalibacillus sp. R45]|uniref:class I SAM-dependent methyltransferase n=1 Tax=Pseudalkalibacillus sp. R45 TaxID=3457433 RepID=UPI003FCE7424